MGLVMTVKGVDFSAVKVDETGISTVVSSGLVALHELRTNTGVATINRGSGADASVSGAPSFSNSGATISSGARVIFGTAPTGSHTFAVIVKIRPGTITTSFPIGSYTGSLSINGGEYLALTTSDVSLVSRPFSSGGVVQGQQVITLTKPATASDELYVARFTNASKAELLHPKDSGIASGNTAHTYNYPSPANYAASMLAMTSGNDEVSLFAHWNRAITDGEIATFYAEMQAYFGNRGVSI